MPDLSDILPSFPVLDFPKVSTRFSIRMFLAFGTSLEVAWFKCPKCQYKDNLYRSNGGISISYCKGNMPAEIEHEQRDLLGQSHGTVKHPVNCAHVNFEHFHGVCKICDYIFGIKIPEGTRE